MFSKRQHSLLNNINDILCLKLTENLERDNVFSLLFCVHQASVRQSLAPLWFLPKRKNTTEKALEYG